MDQLRLFVIVFATMAAVACGESGAPISDAGSDGGGIDGVATPIDATSPDASPDAAPCGDGTVGSGEQCDLGSGNGQPGGCCTIDCQFAAATVTCRAAASSCDVAETCAGDSADCPADLFAPDDSPCVGNGASTCSAADTCQAGQCGDNDAPVDTACSDEPTCNPDVCTATGTCTDVAAASDGLACAERGGSTCCSARCSVIPVGGDCSTCVLRARGPQRITIIESQSLNVGHNMDQRWADVATPLGHTVTIAPQTTLDDLANLATTDILIVSSGLIDLPTNRRATIDQFVSSGRGAYLQGEYQSSYATNQTLAEIVNAHGGSFTWTGTVTGFQDPVTVVGCLATTGEAAPSLTEYWYACGATASGPGVRTIQTNPAGQAIAWSFCMPGGGLLISNTDQDFIRVPAVEAPAHMRNMLLALADAPSCQ
ncbi:MAG: hypothetical protein IPL61_27780 [Myxococcales bacterium]|nr:hypothetical protein [Myxococcales bacterium]